RPMPRPGGARHRGEPRTDPGRRICEGAALVSHTPPRRHCVWGDVGAGDGNRTRMTSLEGSAEGSPAGGCGRKLQVSWGGWMAADSLERERPRDGRAMEGAQRITVMLRLAAASITAARPSPS